MIRHVIAANTHHRVSGLGRQPLKPSGYSSCSSASTAERLTHRSCGRHFRKRLHMRPSAVSSAMSRCTSQNRAHCVGMVRNSCLLC
jgi:hypothetical protein